MIFPVVRHPFQPPCFVDHPFEQPAYGAVVERARVEALHVAENLGLSRRLVDLEPELLLGATDGERALGARAEQAHQRLVQLVDPTTQRVDLVYSPLFSHRT